MIVSAGFTAPDEGKKLASTAGIYLRQVRAQVAASGKLGEEQPVAEESPGSCSRCSTLRAEVEPMIAWKFFAAGTVAPFTGVPWPLPSESAHAAWVEGASGDGKGVHACSIERCRCTGSQGI